MLLILTIILNCAAQPCNIPVFEASSILPELTCIIQCPVLDVSLTSKLILSFLAPILASEQYLALSLSLDEAKDLSTTLSKAVMTPDLNADGHSINELLCFLINFTKQIGVTVESMGQQKQRQSNFHTQYSRHKDVSTHNIKMLISLGLLGSLEKLVTIETIDSTVLEQCLHLLWNIVHEEAMLPVISSAINKILNTPQVKAGTKTDLILCIQWLLGGADKLGNLTSQV